MKKIIYLIGISVLFLISSCNDDDDAVNQSVSEVKLYQPTVQGSFGQFKELRMDATTKAGVIEENDGLTGESFYWHNEDKVKMIFINNETQERTVLTYTADVAEGERPKTAPFLPSGGVAAGNYTVYGLYPADGWNDEGTSVSMDQSHMDLEYIPVVKEVSSEYIGRYMYMKAKAENVEVGEGVSTSIGLSYQQLGSLIRLKITNPNPPDLARLFRLSMGVKLDTGVPEPGFESFFYPIAASLEDIDGTELTSTLAQKTNAARLQIPDEITDLNLLDFNLFIPILPTGPLESKIFTFVGRVYLNEETEYTQLGPLEKTLPESALPNGFEAGKSYVFNLEIPLVNVE
jgi:hypothetical protein